MDYEELPAVQPTKVTYKGKGKAPAKKRKRETEAGDEELNFSGLEDDEFAPSDDGETSQ